MNDEYEGLMIQEARKLVQDKMNRTGMVSRLIEFGITPKLTRWAFMKDGKPTLDWGIEYVKFIDKDTYCVGMYHLPTKRILISRLSFGPGGVPGLTRFAHQMDECQSADDFYERLPKLVDAFIAAKKEYDNTIGANKVNEYVRNCIQKTKTKMPDYFEKCLQQRLKNGIGSTTPAMSLPGSTPWRTITVGPLANIVETTVPFDLVEQKYKPSQEYIYGKGSWSWIIGMDPSCNFDEQKRYIDFSAAMGYQSVLIDAFWDQQIGYEKMAELARYGKEKGVAIFLWYNSNGKWNDAPQTPIGKMDNSRIRRQEMKWMHDNGIRGIKVDFFGGDKQPMMQLYEDILSDANDYGLLVIFHGCTLPRGWERMYPNYAASEAVLASENLHFGQGACDAEARNATIHAFVRNTVGSMDFGGSALNKRYSADNQHGTVRKTSDVYALATAVLFQSAVQHFALAPNNLNDAPAWAIEFMKAVPTTWDEVKLIDGYPGKYVIMARRSGNKWFVTGINAETQPLKKTITLPMFEKGTALTVYSDDAQLNGSVNQVKQNKKQQLTVTIPCNGGLVITN